MQLQALDSYAVSKHLLLVLLLLVDMHCLTLLQLPRTVELLLVMGCRAGQEIAA